MLSRVCSSERHACVDGELAVLVRRILSDFVSDEKVPGSCEVRKLLRTWSVEELPLFPIGGCSAVEHLERFFMA